MFKNLAAGQFYQVFKKYKKGLSSALHFSNKTGTVGLKGEKIFL